MTNRPTDQRPAARRGRHPIPPLRSAVRTFSLAAIASIVQLAAPAVAAAGPTDDIAVEGVVPVETIPLPDPFPVPVLPATVVELPDWLPGLEPDGELPIAAPEGDDPCAEWNAAAFSVAVGPYDDDRVEVLLSYTDGDVCDFPITLIYRDAALDTVVETSPMLGVASLVVPSTPAGGFQYTFDDHELCHWDVQVVVDESLPVTYPGADDCPDAPAAEPPVEPVEPVPPVEPAPPAEPADPPADGPVAPSPDDADDDDDAVIDLPAPTSSGPPTSGPTSDSTDDSADASTDASTDRTSSGPATSDPDGDVVDREELNDEVAIPTGDLPTNGTDSTQLMLGLGLLTLGVGSVVALLTRRRTEDLPTSA